LFFAENQKNLRPLSQLTGWNGWNWVEPRIKIKEGNMQNEVKKTAEIRQVSEREFWIGENRMYLGQDDIIYYTAGGECDEGKAILIRDVAIRFHNANKGKTNMLIDLDKAGKQSPEARNIWKELSEHEKAGKIAILGLNPVARVIASFVMGIAKKEDMRFFKTKEEAFAWLKET
jgi:hypothetical protein